MNSDFNVRYTGEEASGIIEQQLLSGKPLMIARFGSTELNALLNYYFINKPIPVQVVNLLTGIPYIKNYKDGIVKNMSTLSGFFPSSGATLDRFAEMTFEDLKEIDILGSWMKHERYLFNYFKPDHVRVHLEDLSPFNHANPWSYAFKGKKVLVVHPFVESIKRQFEKREHLFKNPKVLPEFELRTVRAVQSVADSVTQYKNWFDALDAMTEDIAAVDFDIAVLGCGAYGMPLAARIKKMGKQAIHLGGATQCLFGVKGKRWEIPFYNYQEKFYNEYWVRPLDSEKPESSHKVEGSCYW